MIKKLTIPVDHGNRNMKTTHFLFTTGLSSTDRKPAGREDFLQTDGKFYVLSDKRIPYQRDKTQDERFSILTRFAKMCIRDRVPGIRVRYCHHPLGESLLYDAEAEYPVHRHYPCKEKGVSGGAMERSLPGSPYGRCRQAQYSSWGADHPLLLSIPE